MTTQRYKTSSYFETELVTLDVYGNFKITLEPLIYRYGPGPSDCHVVPKCKLTDGASAPWFAGLVGLERSELFKLGVLHDDLRDAWYSSNQLTDGFLYDSALSIGKSYLQGLILYYGVRIGTALKYETKIDPHLIKVGKIKLCNYLKMEPSVITFNPKRNIYGIA